MVIKRTRESADEQVSTQAKLARTGTANSQHTRTSTHKNGHADIVELLLPHVDPGERCRDYHQWHFIEDLVLSAAGNGHLKVLKILLPTIAYESHEIGWQVLDAAADSGQLDMVKFAAEYANETDDYGNTCPASEQCGALKSAISGGHVDVANYLLDPDMYRWDILEALGSAIYEKQVAIVERIYEVYPEYVTEDEKQTPSPDILFLHLARDGNTGALKFLYNNGHDDPEVIDEAFLSAADGEHIETMELLYDTGCVSKMTLEKAFKKVARSGCTTPVHEHAGLKRSQAQGRSRGREISRNEVATWVLVWMLVQPN